MNWNEIRRLAQKNGFRLVIMGRNMTYIVMTRPE